MFIRLNIVGGLLSVEWSETVAGAYWARFLVAVNIKVPCIPLVIPVFTAQWEHYLFAEHKI